MLCLVINISVCLVLLCVSQCWCLAVFLVFYMKCWYQCSLVFDGEKQCNNLCW